MADSQERRLLQLEAAMFHPETGIVARVAAIRATNKRSAATWAIVISCILGPAASVVTNLIVDEWRAPRRAALSEGTEKRIIKALEDFERARANSQEAAE